MTDLRDLYGTCSVTPCSCLRVAWLGRMCPNWTPMGPKEQPELAAWHRAAWTLMGPPIRLSETEERQNANR